MLHILLLFRLFLQQRFIILCWHLLFSSFKHSISVRWILICFRHQFFRRQDCFFIQRISWLRRWSQGRLRFQLLSHQWWIIPMKLSILRSFHWLIRVSQLRRLKLIRRGQEWGFILRFCLIQLRLRMRHFQVRLIPTWMRWRPKHQQLLVWILILLWILSCQPLWCFSRSLLIRLRWLITWSCSQFRLRVIQWSWSIIRSRCLIRWFRLRQRRFFCYIRWFQLNSQLHWLHSQDRHLIRRGLSFLLILITF